MASPRTVAVALLVVPTAKPSFALVSSRKHRNKWVFAKGGVERGESSKEAALREAWEEGGLITTKATHLTHLLTAHDPSPHILSPTTDPASQSFVASAKYEFELFVLDDEAGGALAQEWPESEERSRMTAQGWEELEERVCWGRRKDVMKEAIEKAKLWLENWEGKK